MSPMTSLPPLPAGHSGFVSYIRSKDDTPIGELLGPYDKYEAVLRQLFAQEPSNPLLTNGHVNTVPLYNGDGIADLCVQARDPDRESKDVRDKYLLPLKAEERRPTGSPAIVTTFKNFKSNFNLFSENSLFELDWNNVVAAGSSVVTSLLPVPKKYGTSKKQLRYFYHEIFAPASDVDLFIYGLDEEQAIEKIKHIERSVKDTILHETTTIRTKNTITIVSQYPTRHVQIVLRAYKSISEIITGFDVDSSCVAYDGQNVYATPRAVASFITQTNRVDLTRRSPSYENRLAKYSERGFEVLWSKLDRSRIDPTIFERSFKRTTGLARLLVLEVLPTSTSRDEYMRERRKERGRPPNQSASSYRYKMRGNIKAAWENEVAEWETEEAISDYNTFIIPYGKRFHAKKIERLLFSKDLLLNAEWNNKGREVVLHRHPAFFGNAEDVIGDCCGSCPKPVTPEEKEAWELESQIYISGNVSFIKDDPGRQEIGSFNPITEGDWTEMAYIGDTACLFQAIVENDLKTVKKWLSNQNADPNRRDHTGRTALHLAVMLSAPELVQCLVDHGARLISRLADGKTSLHLAAIRGDVEIIRILLHKSEENEAAYEAKEYRYKHRDIESDDTEESGLSNTSNLGTGDDDTSFVTGSFVDVTPSGDDNILDADDALDPDIIDINTIAWDSHASALHLAIIHGHTEAVKELVSSFGADVLLPIKRLDNHSKRPRAAILPLVLSLYLSREKAISMTQLLLQLGATSAQADLSGRTPIHYFAASNYPELFDVLIEHDAPGVGRAINHLTFAAPTYHPEAESALTIAVKAKNIHQVSKLLEIGASRSIDFGLHIQRAHYEGGTSYSNLSRLESEIKSVRASTTQPIILAVSTEQPLIALHLLRNGADPNTLTPKGYTVMKAKGSRSWVKGGSLLDIVSARILGLREFADDPPIREPPYKLKSDEHYLEPFEKGTYQSCFAGVQLRDAKITNTQAQGSRKTDSQNSAYKIGLGKKKDAIEVLLRDFESLQSELIEKGAKTFADLYPDNVWNDAKSSPSLASDAKFFEIKFKFRTAGLGHGKNSSYIKLFEAAWSGDLNTIQEMTLGHWGPQKNMPPLLASATDRLDHSPFTLAVLRGHLGIAKAILYIVRIQYKPAKTPAQIFRLDCDDYSEISSQSDQLPIIAEDVVDEFTVDDIGLKMMEAKSYVSPLEILMKKCKLQYPGASSESYNMMERAIHNHDINLLRFLLDLEQSEIVRGPEFDFSSLQNLNELKAALYAGHLDCLMELIRRTGAGLPLNQLVEGCGVKEKRKPKYYQGLTVHGRKREDWAEAAGQLDSTRSYCDLEPFMELVIEAANVKTLEWSLSTSPSKHYMAFANANKQDERLNILARSENGIEKSIQRWLSSDGDDILVWALSSSISLEDGLPILEFILKNVQCDLERKLYDGNTPLLYALSQRQYHFAKMLLDLIDIRLVPSLVMGRSSEGPGSSTPFAAFIHKVWGFSAEAVEITGLFLDFAKSTGNVHLEVLDGAGNTPVHSVVKCQFPEILDLILRSRPDLVTRENSTGTTPLELAREAWVAECTSKPPPIPRRPWGNIISESVKTFNMPTKHDRVETVTRAIYNICLRVAADPKVKTRTLVSVFEANEVAKRLNERARNRSKQYRNHFGR